MMKLMIGKRGWDVADYAAASRQYEAVRDERVMRGGGGARRFPEGQVFEDGQLVARVSYNARVWKPGPWVPNDTPLYDNRTQEA